MLVVDDAAENRELLALVLGELGLDVALARDGLEAVKRVEAEPFEAILMDIQMPVMDGYEAVGHLRAAGVATPVVALTANAMKGYEASLEEAGFSHYQTKPIDVAALTELLGSLLGGVRETLPIATTSAVAAHGVTNGGEPSNRFARTAATDIDDVAATDDTSPLVSSLLASNPKFHPIVARFLPRLDEETAALRTALEAGEMDGVARIAHWLKGSAGNVGFADFTAPAERLERSAKSGDGAGAARELARIEDLVERVRRGWVDDLPDVRSA